ncbi:MAG TPA: Gmad2 immunoglobulin-like domain-containing protein [Candidatus Saccharimonadales bacterium]|nr:Gmad2 immunoglobulin-like domain-containing protein [Candidatus Saccharimonadales bacterium]
MKADKFLFVIALLILIASIVLYIHKVKTPPVTVLPAATNTDVQVYTPAPNQQIQSPVTIQGKARGTWFFEASFPVKIVDANGKELGHASASTKESWMTSEYVTFGASLKFEFPTTQTGTIILQNDNPSGLEANAKEVRIPVSF